MVSLYMDVDSLSKSVSWFLSHSFFEACQGMILSSPVITISLHNTTTYSKVDVWRIISIKISF